MNMEKKEKTFKDVERSLDKAAVACNLNLAEKGKYGLPAFNKDNTIDAFKIGNTWNVFHRKNKEEKGKKSDVLFKSTSINKTVEFLDAMKIACDLKGDTGMMETRCTSLGGKMVKRKHDHFAGEDLFACSLLRPEDDPGKMKVNNEDLSFMDNEYVDRVKRIEMVSVVKVNARKIGDLEYSPARSAPHTTIVAYYKMPPIQYSHDLVLPIEIDVDTFKEWFKWHDVDIDIMKEDEKGDRIEWDADVTFGKLGWINQSFYGGVYNYDITTFSKDIHPSASDIDTIGLKEFRNSLRNEKIDEFNFRKERAKGFVKNMKKIGYEDSEEVSKAREFIEQMDDELLKLGVIV